jgi:hypothetical protein
MNYQMYQEQADVKVDLEDLEHQDKYLTDDDSSWNVILEDEFESNDFNDDKAQLCELLILLNDQENTDNMDFDLAACEDIYIA